MGYARIVPTSKVMEILKLHHVAPSSGHLGISKTYALVSRKYWFPRMRQRIQHFVQSCDIFKIEIQLEDF